MTRREAEALTYQQNALMSLGFTRQEAESLRRISMTLHRWSEHECNGAIQRDGDNGDGLPFWFNTNTGRKICRVPDRERGALKRLTAIIAARNARVMAETTICPNCDQTVHASNGDCFNECGRRGFTNAGKASAYVQGDPRGCALYILRPGDVPAGKDESAYYSRGIAVA